MFIIVDVRVSIYIYIVYNVVIMWYVIKLFINYKIEIV